jgi:hypothetical protein
MVETVLIIAFSCLLLLYWCRYTILLLLSEDQIEEGAVISQLSLSETRAALRMGPADLPLDSLHRSLENDYRVLRYLQTHAAGMGLRPLEKALLALDYHAMQLWYRLTRSTSATQAHAALQEMAAILTCVASKMGERAGQPSEAR